MDLYHIWFDLKDGISDRALVDRLGGYLEHLKREGAIERWRLSRRKLGLAPSDLGEFHVVIETRDLAQLDRAFDLAAARAGEVETLHHGVNSLVRNARFALYRDFPDPVRIWGEEAF